ncbi:hypothetical protein ACHAXN_007645, partial [Cyclotella atomus]
MIRSKFYSTPSNMTCRLGESPPDKEESRMIQMLFHSGKFYSTPSSMTCRFGESPLDKKESRLTKVSHRHSDKRSAQKTRMLEGFISASNIRGFMFVG